MNRSSRTTLLKVYSMGVQAGLPHFGWGALVGPRNHVLDRVHVGATCTWRIRWHDLCGRSDAGCQYLYCKNVLLLLFCFIGGFVTFSTGISVYQN